MMSTPSNPVTDTHGRPVRSLRISVTDRCNLRCQYCMPEAHYAWLPRESLLSFEEIARTVDIFSSLGVDRVRLTGGEPLLRRDLPDLITLLSQRKQLRDIALTTNGVALAGQACTLRRAGLHRLTISLDTLDRGRYKRLTGRDEIEHVHTGITAAMEAGFTGTKINMVVMRGTNDDEILNMLAFGKRHNIEVRFIEYMDVGGATRWQRDAVFSRDDILRLITAQLGPINAVAQSNTAPAQRFEFGDGQRFGIIASTTTPFCSTCDRTRITADGTWLSCLYAHEGVSIREMLRSDLTDAQLRENLQKQWSQRSDRGAEERLATRDRGPWMPLPVLQGNPHLEMHTRGG